MQKYSQKEISKQSNQRILEVIELLEIGSKVDSKIASL